MKPVSPVIPGFESEEIVIAKDQPEYEPLPSLRTNEGIVITRWELTPEEREKILDAGCLYLCIWTGNGPVQPVFLTTDAPLTIEPDEKEFPEIIEG